MTIFAAEKALWDITHSEDCVREYRSQPEQFLARYHVDAQETGWIRDLDVHALHEGGVSPMLLMQVWNCLVGPQAIAQYLARMNGAQAGSGEASHG